MKTLNAADIVKAICDLPRNRNYYYINPQTKGIIRIIGVTLPEGPIRFKRWNPTKKGTESKAKVENISSEMIWRYANAFQEDMPINIDRVLGASYNTRSVLESLLAHSPQFYYCYPGRIENKKGHVEIKTGHKHLLWLPELPHENGILVKKDINRVISEIPNEVQYNGLEILNTKVPSDPINLDIERRHAQIQIALYFIGLQLGYRTWIAQNDRGLVYQDKKIIEYEGVVQSLNDENLMRSFDQAMQAALMIDCIWFKNGTLMPAVMEVEHSTGVTSGLTRMKNFKDLFPPFRTRYVIVAPDSERDKVIREANKPQFRDLNTKFFSYSAVEELYSLCDRRKIKGITEEFLDCFMEPVLN